MGWAHLAGEEPHWVLAWGKPGAPLRSSCCLTAQSLRSPFLSNHGHGWSVRSCMHCRVETPPFCRTFLPWVFGCCMVISSKH